LDAPAGPAPPGGVASPRGVEGRPSVPRKRPLVVRKFNCHAPEGCRPLPYKGGAYSMVKALYVIGPLPLTRTTIDVPDHKGTLPSDSGPTLPNHEGLFSQITRDYALLCAN
jgi:hypothetical protein